MMEIAHLIQFQELNSDSFAKFYGYAFVKYKLGNKEKLKYLLFFEMAQETLH